MTQSSIYNLWWFPPNFFSNFSRHKVPCFYKQSHYPIIVNSKHADALNLSISDSGGINLTENSSTGHAKKANHSVSSTWITARQATILYTHTILYYYNHCIVLVSRKFQRVTVYNHLHVVCVIASADGRGGAYQWNRSTSLKILKKICSEIKSVCDIDILYNRKEK